MLGRLATVASAVMLVALVLSIAWAEGVISHQAPPHNRGQQAQAKKQDAVSPKSIVQQGKANNQFEGRQESERQSNFFDRPTDWLLVLFNFFLAVFTWRLWIATQNLYTATAAAANATKIAADAGKDQVIELRREYLSTHRPKIILREAITASVLEGKNISILLHIANVGDTVGTIIRSTISAEVVSVPRLFWNSSVEINNDLGQILLNPGEARLIPYQGSTPYGRRKNSKRKVSH